MPRPLGSKNKLKTAIKDELTPKVTIKTVGNQHVEEVQFCQCMQQKGERLYERYAWWAKINKSFDELTDNEQYAWIQTAIHKKLTKPKPRLKPMEVSYVFNRSFRDPENEDLSNI